MNKKQNRFPVFHVPHDGVLFPPKLMESVCVQKEQFFYYHDRMRDTGALKMVPLEWKNKENTLYFPVSRLLCDVERFLGPEEPMERLGMGFCYERAFDGTQIKNISPELLQETLLFYRRHHDRLNRVCANHSRILLLDMHSFSDDIVPIDQLYKGERTPDVCLGIENSFTPKILSSVAEDCLRADGFVTARNYPYSGSLVPNVVLSEKIQCDCATIMLEWNKRVYCDEHGRPVNVSIDRIRNIVGRIVKMALDLI